MDKQDILVDECDLGGWTSGRNKLWQILWAVVGSTIFRYSTDELISFKWSSKIRAFILKLFGSKIGRGLYIRPTVRIEYPWNLEIGDGCAVGDEAWLYNLVKIKLEDGVWVSQRSFLCTGSHNIYDGKMTTITAPVIVGKKAWVGACCFVKHGIRIGEGAVIGAGSVVTKDLPPWKICVGNPCKPVKDRVIKIMEGK